MIQNQENNQNLKQEIKQDLKQEKDQEIPQEMKEENPQEIPQENPQEKQPQINININQKINLKQKNSESREPEFDSIEPVSEPVSEPETEEIDINNINENNLLNPEQIKYKYIDDDELMKDFNMCIDDSLSTPNPLFSKTNSFQINYCIYSINTDCFIEGIPSLNDSIELHDTPYLFNNFQPFIQYVLEKKKDGILGVGSEFYDFPQSSYECNVFSNQEEEDDSEKSQQQIHFENTCYQFVLSCFDKNIDIHNNTIDISKLYKGFIQTLSTPLSSSEFIQTNPLSAPLFSNNQNKENENIIQLYVFFDVTPIINYLKKSQYILSIIDEILYKKKIYSTSINENVTNLFKKNLFLSKIYLINENESEIEVLFPFQLYLCNYSEGEYLNIKKETVEMNHIEQIEHPLLGMAYYFSTYPIKEYESENLKRYSCFMVNDLYIKNDIIELEEEEKEKIKEDVLSASTIYFYENELQLWGIKNMIHFTEL